MERVGRQFQQYLFVSLLLGINVNSFIHSLVAGDSFRPLAWSSIIARYTTRYTAQLAPQFFSPPPLESQENTGRAYRRSSSSPATAVVSTPKFINRKAALSAPFQARGRSPRSKEALEGPWGPLKRTPWRRGRCCVSEGGRWVSCKSGRPEPGPAAIDQEAAVQTVH